MARQTPRAALPLPSSPASLVSAVPPSLILTSLPVWRLIHPFVVLGMLILGTSIYYDSCLIMFPPACHVTLLGRPPIPPIPPKADYGSPFPPFRMHIVYIVRLSCK